MKLRKAVLLAVVSCLYGPGSVWPAQANETMVSPSDGATMVYVPAGAFFMGPREDEAEAQYQAVLRVWPDVKREPFMAHFTGHEVYVDGYWIDRTPVTVAQYRRFCAATQRPLPKQPAWGWKDDHPVINVSWNDASAYAAWAGKRLPTEAEWEKAARGTDGRNYPWGDTWDGSKLAWANRHRGTAPVGSYPAGASPYGALDMLGNVAQWCADWYDRDYYDYSPAENPRGPARGTERVLRGNYWYIWCVNAFSVSRRNRGNPTYGCEMHGFRCAVSR